MKQTNKPYLKSGNEFIIEQGQEEVERVEDGKINIVGLVGRMTGPKIFTRLKYKISQCCTYERERERGDNGLYITLVPKIL